MGLTSKVSRMSDLFRRAVNRIARSKPARPAGASLPVSIRSLIDSIRATPHNSRHGNDESSTMASDCLSLWQSLWLRDLGSK